MVAQLLQHLLEVNSVNILLKDSAFQGDMYQASEMSVENSSYKDKGTGWYIILIELP